jgi:dienelactone hydrolase
MAGRIQHAGLVGGGVPKQRHTGGRASFPHVKDSGRWYGRLPPGGAARSLPAMCRLALLLLALAAPAAAESLTLPGPEGVALRAWLVRPEAVRAAPVIALHGCMGLGGPEAPPRLAPREADWAARLAALGHPVLFPDSFGSRGLGDACGRPEHRAPPRLRAADARAAAAWARAQPWGQAGRGPVLLGWSHGGSTALLAWLAAAPGELAAVIAFYPGCGPLSIGRPEPGPGRAPLLMLLGAEDDWTPPEPCLALAARAPEAATARLLPGARHGFDMLGGPVRAWLLPNGRRVHLGPEPAAREAARAALPAFLARHAGTP